MKIRGNTVGTPIKPKAALVKCEDLTPEEQARARQNIGAMATAADSDLNMQHHNINNVKELAFNSGNYNVVVSAFNRSDMLPRVKLLWDTKQRSSPGNLVGLSNIADGVEDADAATVGQLNKALENLSKEDLGGTFYVSVSSNIEPEAGGNSGSSPNTYEEVVEAYNAGKAVFCKVDGSVAVLSSVDESTVTFVGTTDACDFRVLLVRGLPGVAPLYIDHKYLSESDIPAIVNQVIAALSNGDEVSY